MSEDTTAPDGEPVERKVHVYISDRSQAPAGVTVKRDTDGDLYYETAGGYRGDPDRDFEVPVYDPEDITDPRTGTNTPETGVFDRDDWYGDDPGDIGLAGIACPLSELPATRQEMDALTVEYKEWVPYKGPEGGDGWRNTDTDEIVYDDEPPGEIVDTPQARGREVQQEVGDIMGDNPGRDEYAEAEAYLETELAVENVDLSDFDAAQVETTAAELGRLDDQGDLDNLSEINSQVPDQARETYGDLPMHYDRDGEAVSINPQAMTDDMAGALANDGVISTADAEHFLRHMVGAHNHSEAIENGDTDPEGDPSESAEQQLSEEGIDVGGVASSVGTLALATGVTLVAETWALLEGGKQPSDAALEAYRYFGGPTLGDVTGDSE